VNTCPNVRGRDPPTLPCVHDAVESAFTLSGIRKIATSFDLRQTLTQIDMPRSLAALAFQWSTFANDYLASLGHMSLAVQSGQLRIDGSIGISNSSGPQRKSGTVCAEPRATRRR